MLVFKGRMELEETKNMWKTKAHIMKLLNEKEEQTQNIPYFQQFLEKTKEPLSPEMYRRRFSPQPRSNNNNN
jgi:hypothetical protein